MINFDDVAKENIKEHNPNWPQIPNHPYRILKFNYTPCEEIYFYAKDLNEAKYQFLIKKREDVETMDFNESKAFIEYSNDMDHINRNIEEYK